MPRASRTSDDPEPAEGQVPAGDYEPVHKEILQKDDVSNNSTKSVNEVALEVIAGHWGRGNVCKKRLQNAGYDVAEVSEEVTRVFNKK